MRVWRWAKVASGDGGDVLEDGSSGDEGIGCGGIGCGWPRCESLTTCGLGDACWASKDLSGVALDELDDGAMARADVRGAMGSTRAGMLLGNTKATSASGPGLITRVRFESIDRPRQACLVACGVTDFGLEMHGRSLAADFVGDGTGV